jgi:release factor glutamine methyltransferase
MSLSLSPTSLPQVVLTLRRAGCVVAEDEARMLLDAATTPAELTGMIAKRIRGIPLEHIVGWAQFCGIRIVVDPGVFVPRRRTEFLVSEAGRVLALRAGAGRTTTGPPAAQASVVVVDLCCGSGNVGAALRSQPGCGEPTTFELHASDIDTAAVRCAHRNLSPGISRGIDHVYTGDLYEPLPRRLRGAVDLIVADAPYVPTEEIVFLPTEARLHEASVALDGGVDGLDLHRRLAAQASEWLAPGGSLLVETSRHQAPASAAIFAAAGLAAEVMRCDELDATVVRGARAPSRADAPAAPQPSRRSSRDRRSRPRTTPDDGAGPGPDAAEGAPSSSRRRSR